MKTWLTIIAFLVSSTLLAAPTKQHEAAANLKPLTFQNVVSFFKQAHLRPTEVQKRCTIFFEGEWKSADVYSYCVTSSKIPMKIFRSHSILRMRTK